MARGVVCGLGLLFVLTGVAGCGGGDAGSPSAQQASGQLRVREVHVTGSPFPIEGEYSYVRVEGEEHRLDPPGELRLQLPAGSRSIEVWHRYCDGNCGTLDPPTDRCAADLTVAEGATALATIQNAPGSPCAIVAGRVGIAYAQTDTRDLNWKRGSIWFAAPDGTHAVRLAAGYGGVPPDLSPDGKKVAFVRLHDNPRFVEVYVVPSVGGAPTLLRRVKGRTAFITGLTWSPDSLRLVTAENPGFYLLRTRSPARAKRFVKNGAEPSFSPDGTEIAYARVTPRTSDIFAYEVARGKTRRVTRGGRSALPLWGPGGIAFTRFLTRGAHYDIWTARFPGRQPERLTRTRSGIYPVAWSADGSRLLAANPANHNGRLWAVDANSGAARPVTGWVGDLFGQALSYDGRTILAALGCGGMIAPVGKIETIPFAGGEPHLILEGPCRASWNG